MVSVSPTVGHEVLNPNIGYKGVYGRMFHGKAPAAFAEYPKQLTLLSGKHVIVESLKEELNVRAEQQIAGNAPEAHPLESERDELAAKLSDAQQALRESNERMAKMEAQLQALLAAKEQSQGQNVPQSAPGAAVSSKALRT